MNNITMAFLAASGMFFVLGVIMIFYKPKDKEKELAEKFDNAFPMKLHKFYFEKSSIEEAFKYLLYEYEEDKYMASLIEKTIEYLNGDYGDYETALSIMNVNDNEELERVNEEIIRIEVSKHWALPMK